MAFMKVYKGKIVENKYPASLAYSVHFAIGRKGEAFENLNQGYGILFARAAIREDNTYRYGIGTPKDTGSMLYIATVDEACPYRLSSEPVLLSRPLYGWENVGGTINNEGPYALILGDTVYLTYSGGDACGYYYTVGYLTAPAASDLLDTGNWTKLPTAIFSSSSVKGIQGPGHNSFFRDEQGRLMIAYHAQERKKYFKRCTAFHRVHISESGFPLLNVAGERDVAEELRKVELIFHMNT